MAHKVVNYKTKCYRIRKVFISMHMEEEMVQGKLSFEMGNPIGLMREPLMFKGGRRA